MSEAALNPSRTVSAETVLSALRWRYATKVFDPARQIPDSIWSALEESLVLTPSSYGLQPWKFVVVTDRAVREKLLPHSWNQRQVVDCSRFVVFAAQRKLVPADLDRWIARIAEVRSVAPESLRGYRDMMKASLVDGPKSASIQEWAARQVYIALGNFMTSAALLGVDACPMEGIAPAEYDRILGLEAMGFATVVACAAGYRAAGDGYAAHPKIRYPKDRVIEKI